MKYLFAQWSALVLKLKKHPVCIFLDYDGVLAPIADTPQQALMSKTMKHVLRGLANNSACILAVITGRSIEDIKHTIKIKNIIYAGNHGLEFGNLQTTFKIPVSSKYKIILKEIKNRLTKNVTTRPLK